ncbi:MAG TPA: DUF6152 family protein [Gammaproteobacteria bacterium]
MIKYVPSIAFAAGLALLTAPFGVSAHHSFAAEFDRELPITVTGTVTKVEWLNPHARFYVATEDESGGKVEWDFELTSPNVLMRRGWTRTSLKVGDVVTVTGYRARNDPHVVNASNVMLADGTRLFTGAAVGQ